MIELAEPDREPAAPVLEVALEPTKWFEWAWTPSYAAKGRTQVSDAVPPEATWSRPLFAPKLASFN